MARICVRRWAWLPVVAPLAGVLAFAVLATLAVKRWGVRNIPQRV
jgi:hypothetical protein